MNRISRSRTLILLLILNSISILLENSDAPAQWLEPIFISETNMHCTGSKIAARGSDLFAVYFNLVLPRFIESNDCGLNWSNPLILTDSTIIEGLLPDILLEGDTIHIVFTATETGRAFVSYFRSTDLGQSWENPRRITSPLPWTRYATINKVNGTLVCIYTADGPTSDSTFVMGIRSTNDGRSWGSPYRIWHDVNATYYISSLQSDGRLHLIFGLGAVNSLEIAYMKSDDGGITWSNPIYLSSVDQYGSQWPRAAVDSAGLLAVSWFDYKYGSGGGGLYGDILMNISTDNGNSWSGERRITFLHLARTSAVAVDSPNVYATYEDIRDGRGGEIYFRWSSDLGIDWSDEERLTDDISMESSDPALAISTCDGERNLHLSWSQEVPTMGHVAIFYSRTQEPTNIIKYIDTNLPSGFKIVSIYPNPFNSKTFVEFQTLIDSYIKIEIFDIRGEKVSPLYEGFVPSGMHKIIVDADNFSFSSGTYFIRISKGGENQVGKVLFLK